MQLSHQLIFYQTYLLYFFKYKIIKNIIYIFDTVILEF